MDRSLITGLAIGAVIVAAGAAVAGYRMMDQGPQYAQVLAVHPIMRRLRTPHEVCKSEEVRNQRGGDTYTTTEQHCATVFDIREERQGFDVQYRLNGVEGEVHMDRHPGSRIPIRDGKLAPGAG